jgi:hypothetical protein
MRASLNLIVTSAHMPSDYGEIRLAVLYRVAMQKTTIVTALPRKRHSYFWNCHQQIKAAEAPSNAAHTGTAEQRQ